MDYGDFGLEIYGLRFWAWDFGNMVSGFFGLDIWAAELADGLHRWIGARCLVSEVPQLHKQQAVKATPRHRRFYDP